MDRRNFILNSFAIPISLFLNRVSHSEKILLPGKSWFVLAGVGYIYKRFNINGDHVTHMNALKLSRAIKENWNDLQWHFNFYISVGYDNCKATGEFLLGKDWKNHVHQVEQFVKNGTFHLIETEEGVTLVRGKD